MLVARLTALLLAQVALVAANVVDLTPENFDEVVGGPKPVFVKFYAEWCGHCKKLTPDWEKLGEMYADAKSKAVIARVDAATHKELGERFGVTGFPTLKWFPAKYSEGDKVETYNEDRNLDKLNKFVAKLLGAPVPEPVKFVRTLTDENFDEVALNKSAHVLVKFYAPWCGHCKNMASDYEQLAKAFALEPTCVVAELDATEHKEAATRYNVQGYPTLKFFSIEAKDKPDEYEGGRTLDEMIAFLNEKCGTNRKADGLLGDLAGVVSDLTPLLSALTLETDTTQLKKLVKDLGSVATKLVSAQPYKAYLNSAVAIYNKFAESYVKKGAEYGAKELGRLERLISKELNTGKILPEKLDNMLMRRNILRAVVSPSKQGEKPHDEL